MEREILHSKHYTHEPLAAQGEREGPELGSALFERRSAYGWENAQKLLEIA